MQRIKTSTAAQEKPVYSAAGEPGFFTVGNAVAAIPATVMGQDWPNMIQEEIVNVILAAGIELDAATDTQLRDAIGALIASALATIPAPDLATEIEAGLARIASAADVVAAEDIAAFINPARLASALAAALANFARLDTAQTWTKAQTPALVSHANVSGTVAVDLDTDQLVYVSATGALTIADPTHMAYGRSCLLCLHAAAAQTVSWGSAWHGTSLVSSLPTALTAGKALLVSAVCVVTPNGTYMLPVGILQEA